MSQLQSYEEQFAANKIATLEQELIKFKAKQPYGMNDVQVFTSNSFTESSHTFPAETYDHQFHFTASATNILRIRFTGNKPSKTVIGLLKYSIQETSHGTLPAMMAYIKGYRGSAPNVIEWIVCANGGNNGFDMQYTTFNITFSAITNEIGKLSIEGTWDIGTYYQWVLG